MISFKTTVKAITTLSEQLLKNDYSEEYLKDVDSYCELYKVLVERMFSTANSNNIIPIINIDADVLDGVTNCLYDIQTEYNIKVSDLIADISQKAEDLEKQCKCIKEDNKKFYAYISEINAIHSQAKATHANIESTLMGERAMLAKASATIRNRPRF